MITRFYLLTTLLFFFTKSYSQIIVMDINNKPIPFVEVLSSNKHFYTQTNLNGEINWADLKNLKNGDTLFFQLITYERISIPFADLSSSDTIRLKERVHQLQEFSVVSNTKKYKFQILNACYRSYQVNDDSVAYYIDGKVGYLSKIGKDKYDLLLKENRVLENKEIDEQTLDRKISIGLKPSIPRPPLGYLPFNFYKKGGFIYHSNDSSIVKTIDQESIQLGRIEYNEKHVKLNFNDSSFNGTNNMLKSEIKREKREITLIFKNSKELDFESTKTFDHLIYYRDYREYSIKHNKDEEYTRIIQIDELFIEDVTYTKSIDKDIYSSSWRQNNSNYISEFWNNCNCEIYQTPNKYLLKNLHEK